MVVEDAHGGKVALVACDVLMVNRDVLDRAARRIEQATGIPFDHILINATHTHHAPTTCHDSRVHARGRIHSAGRRQDRSSCGRRRTAGSAR